LFIEKKGRKRMTVITGLFTENTGLLLGDILISEETTNEVGIYLPTRGYFSTKRSYDQAYKPSCYFQKVNLLSPKLAIAWSGSMDNAVMYISEIVDSNSHINPEIEKIIEITNDADPELQILGIMVDKDKYYRFGRNCEQIKKIPIGSLTGYIGGCGADKLETYTENMVLNITSGNPSQKDRLLADAMGIISILLSEEVRSNSTIQNLFGAGYEIVYLDDDNNLKKLSDLTYVFWNVTKETNLEKRLISPVLINKYFYHEDQLYINSYIPRDYPNFEHYTTIVPPIFPPFLSSQTKIIQNQNLNSKFTISIYFTKVDGKIYVTSRFGTNSTETCPIIFENSQTDDFKFTIDSKIVNDHINSFFNNFKI
jgi:hypothetical protein